MATRLLTVGERGTVMSRAEQLDYLHWLLTALASKGHVSQNHAELSQKIVEQLQKEVIDE